MSNFYLISNATQRKRSIDKKYISFFANFLKKYVWPVQQGREGRTSGRQTFRAEPEITICCQSISIVNYQYIDLTANLSQILPQYIFVSDFRQLCLIQPTFFLSRSKVMLSRSTTQTEKATDFRRVWNDWIFWIKLLSDNHRISIQVARFDYVDNSYL